jgi:tape measure domain-containing protein
MALTIKIRADASHFKKTIAGIEVQASGLTGVMGKLATSQAAFGAALAAAAAGAVALGAGLAFIKDASGKAAGMESLTAQFEVLTGSAVKAKDLIKTFRDEAVKSPLNVQDYAKAALGFMSYGVQAEKVLPILKMLGDVSMGNAERFGLLSYAMAQIASNTTLKGDDLRQLVEQGFNPLAVIAEKTGRSMGELRKDMEKGLITYDMVEGALKVLTSAGGRFYGAIEKGSATTEGKIAKLGDSILGLKVAFGTGFNEGLKTALDATNSFLPQLESRFAAAGDFLGKALTESISGDTEKFAALGVLVGTAFWSGFKEVGGNVVVESMRGILQSTAGASEREQQLMSEKLTGLLGPKPTMQDVISRVGTGMQPAIEGIERASTPDWNKQLEEQRRRVDQEILNEAKKTNQLLQKSATVGLYPTSR